MRTSERRPANTPARPSTAIPPLEAGDRLTEREFCRRYAATPAGVRAELLRGAVHVIRWFEPGPIGRDRLVPFIQAAGHGQPLAAILGALGNYTMRTPGVRGSAPTTIHRVTPDSTAEPDGCLRILPEFGKRSDNAGEFIEGGPEVNPI